MERRAQDHSVSLSVHEALEALRGMGTSDIQIMQRADNLGKRLYGVQQALEHSHGGGLGTPEQQPSAKGSGGAARQEAGALVAALCSSAGNLANKDVAEPTRSLATMEEHTARLEVIIRQLLIIQVFSLPIFPQCTNYRHWMGMILYIYKDTES